MSDFETSPEDNSDSQTDAEIISVPEPSPPTGGWRSAYVWIVFAVLLFGWPLLTVLSSTDDPSTLSALTGDDRLLVYTNTGAILWIVFLLVWSAQRAARRPLAELGFTEPSLRDPFIAMAFLFAANITLNGLVWVLGAVGMETPELTIKGLLPETGGERFAWIMLSISAGICEESCFRGFLLLRGKAWLGRWWPIVILSSVAFGLGHLYQGTSGAILICVYGVMFCLLRLWRGSLWPGIWAHIWQDIGAMALGVSGG